MDKLESQSKELVESLKDNNVSCTSLFFNDKRLLHQYQFMLWTKEAINTLEKVVNFINNRVEK